MSSPALIQALGDRLREIDYPMTHESGLLITRLTQFPKEMVLVLLTLPNGSKAAFCLKGNLPRTTLPPTNNGNQGTQPEDS